MDDVRKCLTQAIEEGDFNSALKLVEEYGEAVREELRAAAPEDFRASFLKNQKDLQRQLELARVVRSHISAHLASVVGESRYLDVVAPSHTTWEMQG